MGKTHICINKLPIRLGQFLKVVNIAQDGIEAKLLIQEGNIIVNQQVETKRGKKLRAGDSITYQDMEYIITTSQNRC